MHYYIGLRQKRVNAVKVSEIARAFSHAVVEARHFARFIFSINFLVFF